MLLADQRIKYLLLAIEMHCPGAGLTEKAIVGITGTPPGVVSALLVRLAAKSEVLTLTKPTGTYWMINPVWAKDNTLKFFDKGDTP